MKETKTITFKKVYEIDREDLVDRIIGLSFQEGEAWYTELRNFKSLDK
jgi:hypothetical protein